MEAHVKPGLVHLTDADVSQWKRFETLDELDLPTDRPGPRAAARPRHVLLDRRRLRFAGRRRGRPGFLRTLIFAYDAVIGFDHKTLSVDPKQNAEDLLSRLRTHQPGASSSST